MIKYLWVLQLRTMEMKENIGNEYIRRVKLICKSNLNAGIYLWLECLGYSCDEVQQRNYRLDKRNFRTWTRKLER